MLENVGLIRKTDNFNRNKIETTLYIFMKFKFHANILSLRHAYSTVKLPKWFLLI